MTKPDTSAEAVERSIEELLGWLTGPDSGHNDGVVEAVGLIRALAAERDDWHAATIAVEGLMKARGTNRDYWESRCEHAEADRDRLAAENARLRSVLRDLLRVIEGDDLIPETVSYMRNARAALGDAT